MPARHAIVCTVLCAAATTMASAFPIIVSTTTDQESAVDAITAAVESHNTKPLKKESIRSFYWWDGKVADEKEFRLHVTTDSDFADVKVCRRSPWRFQGELPAVRTSVGGRDGGRWSKGRRRLPQVFRRSEAGHLAMRNQRPERATSRAPS